ncbi:MAG: cytochrome P460 family protein [Candidatus Sericytochromatia bacterium]|nr:cytochrome P460 family protein [Candidatus Sericytochromatia bacterium]
MNLTRLLLSSAALFALAACNASPSQAPVSPSAPGTDNGVSAPAEGMSDTEIQTLVQNYQSFPALNEELKRSGTHENMMVRTYLDPTAMAAFNSQSYPYANGTEIVKQGHKTADGPVEALFIMKKIAGYDPENGDWFYAMTNGDGMVGDKGRIQMCISCHGAVRSKDFVYGFE